MIGKTVSHYKIIEKLGEGGMGVVFRAEDMKLDRIVALKFLAPHILAGDEENSRFMHEAKASAALNHPNICTVYEIDEADSQPFIAMECVDGESLREKIAEAPLPIERARDIAMQIADGLGSAHEKGIVHRDVKSANIMITSRGRVKIMDFGLARSSGRTQLTRDGATLGTAAYMSPEQTSRNDVDQRADIWSLGVILYEMITGRRPFGADYEQAVLYSIVHEEPEPPTSLRTGIPMELERIVLKCLRKNPDDRYQDTADLMSDLRQLDVAGKAGGTGISNRSGFRGGAKSFDEGSTGRQPADTRRMDGISGGRRRLLQWISISALAVIAVVIVLVRILGDADEPVPDRRQMIVVLPFENLGPSEDEFFAEGMTEEITSRLAAIRRLGVISRTSALRYRNTGKTVGEIGDELGVDFVLEGTIRWDREANGKSNMRLTIQLIRVSDDSHIWAESYDESFEAIFDVQSRIAENVAGELNVMLSSSEQDAVRVRPTENFIAYQAYLRGLENIPFGHLPEKNYRSAQKMFEQAITLDPEFALAYAKLSHAHRSLYFLGYERTSERLKMAKTAIDKALELQPDLVEAHREFGYYYYQGLLDYDNALKEFSLVAENYQNDAQLLEDIGYIWRRQGHFEQALASFESALKINPMDPFLLLEVANTYGGMRRFDEAIEYADKVIEIAPLNHWSHLIKAGCLLEGRGDVQAALSTIEKSPVKSYDLIILMSYWLRVLAGDFKGALDKLEVLGEDIILTQSWFYPVAAMKGKLYYIQGDSVLARSEFESARVILERAVAENPEDHRIHSSLGKVLAGLGRKEEAIAAGRRGVQLCPTSRDAIIASDRIFGLAEIYSMVGEHELAIEQIRTILQMYTMYTTHHFELDLIFEPLYEEPGYKSLVREYSIGG